MQHLGYIDGYMTKGASEGGNYGTHPGIWLSHLQKIAEQPNPIPDGIDKYERPAGQEHDPKCAVPDEQRQPAKPHVSDPKDSER